MRSTMMMRGVSFVLAAWMTVSGCTPVISAPLAGRKGPSSSPTSGVFRYQATASPHADELRIEVEVPGGTAAAVWEVDPEMTRFGRDVRLNDGEAPASSGGGWNVPACPQPCRLRYRVLLRDAARALDDQDRAQLQGEAIFTPPSAWMLRPRGFGAPFRLRVATPAGTSFVSGLARAGDDADGFEGTTDKLDDTPYAAFGPFTPWTRVVGGASVDVAFFPDRPTPAMKTWVDGALGAIADYYGRFPIPHAALLVRLDPGRGVNGGRTMGHGGGSVVISAGEETDAKGFLRDWMLVHELVHVSFPEVGSAWAEEGIATYLEPIIRVRAKLCDADELWRSLVEGLPQGQPEAGDGGLDVTDTWGRRYWGGALFWFLADVEIRERTGNKRGLDDVLRALNQAGANVAVRWQLDNVLAFGDATTGVDVLVPLRQRLGRAPGRADLEGLWKKLGVSVSGGRMIYDDHAPLADVRLGILRGKRRDTSPLDSP